MNYTRILTFTLIFVGTYLQASEQHLVQNILHNTSISKGEGSEIRWSDMNRLSSQLVGMYILHNHPIIPYILSRLSIPSKTLGNPGEIESVTMNHEGTKVVTSSENGLVKIWDIKTGLCEYTQEDPAFDTVSYAALNKHGDKLITRSDNDTIKIWDIANNTCLKTFTFDTIEDFDIASESSLIIVLLPDGTTKVLDIEGGTCIHTIKTHNDGQYIMLSVSPCGRFVTYPEPDERSRSVWDGRSGKLLSQISNFEFYVPAFDLEGSKIASDAGYIGDSPTTYSYTCDDDDCSRSNCVIEQAGVVEIYDTENGKLLVKLKPHHDFINAQTFDRSGKKVLTVSEDTTGKIWDAQTGQCLKTLKGHSEGVKSGKFSWDSTFVVTTSEDKTAKIWLPKTGTCLKTLVADNDEWFPLAQFDKSGCFLLTRTSQIDKIWNTAKIWDIGAVKKIADILLRDDQITFNQAFILISIYEVIQCREKVAAKGLKDLFIKLPKEFDYTTYGFDFNKYSHLQKEYEDLPAAVQTILDPYVRKADLALEASTSSEKRIKIG